MLIHRYILYTVGTHADNHFTDNKGFPIKPKLKLKSIKKLIVMWHWKCCQKKLLSQECSSISPSSLSLKFNYYVIYQIVIF